MAATPEILLPYAADNPEALTHAELDRIEQRLERIATSLDSAFRIPGTQVRFGADAILGLVPVLGDLVATGLSGYLILEARRLGAPPFMLARMGANVAVDAVFGSVPVVGSVFDVFYKANKRNIAILREHLSELRSRTPKVVSPPQPRRAG